MPKLTYSCPICDKPLVLTGESTLSANKLYTYKCGHCFASPIHEALDTTAPLDLSSTDGSKHARPYQEDGVRFILDSNFNCIIGDQMRLGKTPQSLLALKQVLADKTTLIIVRGANLWQWTREFKTWVTTLPNGIFPIQGSKAWIPHGFSAYIISMDTFSRPAVLESLKQIPFNLIIADEAHSFKNPDSNRSQALVDFVKVMNTGEEVLSLDFSCSNCQSKWVETGKRKYDKRHAVQTISKSAKCPNCRNYCYMSQSMTEQQAKDPSRQPCGLILLTGTVIKNRADEFFVPLNLIAPERFPSLSQFQHEWLSQDPPDPITGKSSGKYSRIKSYKLDQFKTLLKPHYLRREKEDVFKELPPLNRIFTLIEPDKDALVKQYNKVLDVMDVKLAEKVNPSFWDSQSEMMELRRICGLMKVMWTADYLESAISESENERFAVGIHHKSVRDVLKLKLGGDKNCLMLSGLDDRDRKDWVMRHFETSSQRILIINELAGGVGMDFHYCDNVTVLERQWNSADEEQFESRFYNPDLKIKENALNVEYILVKGSFEQFWHDMVEEKRHIFGETVANNWSIDKDPGSFKQLVEATLASRL